MFLKAIQPNFEHTCSNDVEETYHVHNAFRGNLLDIHSYIVYPHVRDEENRWPHYGRAWLWHR